MKAFITGMAILIILILLIVFWQDHLNYRLQAEFLKHCADEASASAMLYYDNNDNIYHTGGGKHYGEIIFDESEGIKAIEHIIKEWLRLDDNFIAKKDSYYKGNSERVHYTAYFFDDDGICSIYIDGKYEGFLSDFNDYPYTYKDKELKYEKTIGSANVVVTVNAGKARFRLPFIKEPILIRSSGYDYEY